MATVLELHSATNGTNRPPRRDLNLTLREPVEREFAEIDTEAIKQAVRTILRAVAPSDWTGSSTEWGIWIQMHPCIFPQR